MNNKGFTLIELLVVVLIIGILAAIALPQYMKAVEKSRATEAITLLSNIANAEKIYEMGMGTFTNDLSALDITFNNMSSSKTFGTNNFNFEVITPSGNAPSTSTTFLARATRNSSTMTYRMNIKIDPDGTVTKWCGTGTDQTPQTLGTGDVAAMCKSISNGNAKGEIK